MRIGELSRRTGVPARMLRYYEAQELLRPGREQNGYHCYHPGMVDLVRQIRGLPETAALLREEAERIQRHRLHGPQPRRDPRLPRRHHDLR